MANPSAASTGQKAVCVVIMGVSGCGKSTVGSALAKTVGATFIDADDLHPSRNVEKMRAGKPLTDDDRWPWLDLVGGAFAGAQRPITVIACSALRRAYRERITSAAGTAVLFLHLRGTKDVISARLAARVHDYMPTSLLESQFATLESPREGELAESVDINVPLDDIVATCAARVRQHTHKNGQQSRL